MSKVQILEELPKLSLQERQEISAKLNELEGVADNEWLGSSELNAAEKAMLNDRLIKYEKNPNDGSSWPEVMARISSHLRR